MLEEGHELLVLDDLSSGSRDNLFLEAEFREIDIRSRDLKPLLDEFRPDVFIHAAAQISVTESMKDPVYDAEVNVCGLLNILHSLGGRTLPYFVFLSTGGAIYGEQEDFPADEGHKIEPTSVYGTSKRVSELYLALWGRVYGLKYVALRLANVYGPRQNPHGEAGVVAIFNNRLLRGGTPVIYGSGEQTRDFVFVKDVAQAVALVCRDRIQGIFNIGTGRETSVNALYEIICGVLGITRQPLYQPAREGEQMRSSISAVAARRTFGWQPAYTLEEGLRQTCEWFQAKAA